MLGLFTRFIASPISGYLAVAMGALVLVLSVSLWISNHRLDNARIEAFSLRGQLGLAVSANQTNLDTIKACEAINAVNAAQRQDAANKAMAAELRAAELEQLLIDSMGDTFEPQDTECRKLDEPLPADFIDWLRGSAGRH